MSQMKLTGSSPLDDPTMVTGLSYLSFSPRSVSEELSTEKDKKVHGWKMELQEPLHWMCLWHMIIPQPPAMVPAILEKESKEWLAISIEFLWTAEKVWWAIRQFHSVITLMLGLPHVILFNPWLFWHLIVAHLKLIRAKEMCGTLVRVEDMVTTF